MPQQNVHGCSYALTLWFLQLYCKGEMFNISSCIQVDGTDTKLCFAYWGVVDIHSKASSCIQVGGVHTKSCEVFVSLIGALLHTFKASSCIQVDGIHTKSCEVFVSLIGALLHTFKSFLMHTS